MFGIFFAAGIQGVLLKWSQGSGRLIPILATEGTATASLFCIGISAMLFPIGTWQAALSFFVFFQIRIIFRGVSAPLYESLEQDMVPASQRGRFGAIRSIHGIASSVAAITGGYFIDTIGFIPTFMAVGVFQTLSILVFLIPIMERINFLEKKLREEKEAKENGEKKAMW